MKKLNLESGQLEETVLACRLSLERCRMYLSHLCVVIHLGEKPAQTECAGGRTMLDLMEGLERELRSSIANLGRVLK